jgi:hypothetical protein
LRRMCQTLDWGICNSWLVRCGLLRAPDKRFSHTLDWWFVPASTPRRLVHKKTWRDSLPIDMLLYAVCVLVVAQPSSEVPEELMNYPVFMSAAWIAFRTTDLILLLVLLNLWVGQDSTVGIVTRYGLDGLGIESQWRRDFPHLSGPTLGPTQPPIQWAPGLFRG